jgi:hypothetical protein
MPLNERDTKVLTKRHGRALFGVLARPQFQFAFLGILALIVATFVVMRFGIRMVVDVGQPTAIHSPMRSLESTTDGEVVGIETSSYHVEAIRYKIEGHPHLVDSVTFSPFERPWGGDRGMALSREFDWYASYSVYGLTSVQLRGGSRTDSTSGVRVRGIRGIAFTRDGLLVALADSALLIFECDPVLSLVRKKTLGISSPVNLEVHGNYVVISSKIFRRLEVVDPHYAPDSSRVFTLPSIASKKDMRIAVSPLGKVACATGANSIYDLGAIPGGIARSVEVPHDVMALAFYDEDRLLAAETTGGVYEFSGTEEPRLMLQSESPVRAITVSFGNLALIGDSGVITVYPHRLASKVTIVGELIGGGGIVLAALLFYGAFRKRNTKEISEAGTTPGTTKQEGERHDLPLTIPQDLIEAFEKGECVLFAGAGMSARAGYPTWGKFLQDLLEWAIMSNAIPPDTGRSLRASIAAQEWDAVADSLVSALMERSALLFYDHLRKVFLETRPVPAVHRSIARMKFSAIMTTNFDELFEKAYAGQGTSVYTPKDTESLFRSLTKREFFILHLYGTLGKVETVAVSPDQFEASVKANRAFSEFMETLFFSRTIVFLGASLSGIEAYLKGITLPRDLSRKHYALVELSGSAWHANAEVLNRRYGIVVIPYTTSGSYGEVGEFLDLFPSQAGWGFNIGPASQPGNMVPSNEASRLQRLVMKNIGPFGELDLTFDREWNILLGDNGVGKSSILKAIALALCGNSAQQFADHMLKSGEEAGFISLTTDRGTQYRTELVRNQRDVEIQSSTGRPIDSEGWLAVGFPPLRVASRDRSRVNDSPRARDLLPGPADILPIISGGGDPRVDTMTEWIVNLDSLRLKNEEMRKGQGGKYGLLINEFFRVINELTEGMSIQFDKVDEFGRLLVRTDDGVVPIESISQGSTSLIGWVGILMQRLFEVHDVADKPMEKYALVLMDEIDAHMHPAWQQALVSNLRRLFPKIQFIATTHSPLIVSGMPPCQLFRFKRIEGKIRQIETEDLRGWRVDQILTSATFGLAGARDKETVELMARYTELISRFDLLPEEKGELETLAARIQATIPLPHSLPEARAVAAMMEESFKNQLNALSEEERVKVVRELRAQVNEALSGARRPS